MDLVAEQLLLALQRDHAMQFNIRRACPQYVHFATRLLGQRGTAKNVDRLRNRFITYPRFARKICRDFDLFHLCDHSYSQVIHGLPPKQTGVFCHDLDTFRCILDPASEPRPRWFRAMAKKILTGMQKASIVFHATMAVRAQIEKAGLVDPARLIHAPPGVSTEFFEPIDAQPSASTPTILHVGSCIPRKRIDVLLDVFAAVHRAKPDVRLIQIGGDFTPAQRDQITRLGIQPLITQSRGLTRTQLARQYRTASVVLVTSEAEGFGLPVAEALATGATVIASDIPVLREVGGDAAIFAPVADVQTWTSQTLRVLADPTAAPDRTLRLRRGELFSWKSHAATIAGAYEQLLRSNS